MKAMRILAMRGTTCLALPVQQSQMKLLGMDTILLRLANICPRMVYPRGVAESPTELTLL